MGMRKQTKGHTRENGRRWVHLGDLDLGAGGDSYLDQLEIIKKPFGGLYVNHIDRPDREPWPLEAEE